MGADTTQTTHTALLTVCIFQIFLLGKDFSNFNAHCLAILLNYESNSGDWGPRLPISNKSQVMQMLIFCKPYCLNQGYYTK